MASRRMFHIDKIQTDFFLSLMPSAQALFLHCMLTADDNGFVARPLALVRMVGCSREDLDALIREGFLIVFPSGVILVKHWRVHNCIRHDRYHASILPERKLVGWDDLREYFLLQEKEGLTSFAEEDTLPAQEKSPVEEETPQPVETAAPAPQPEEGTSEKSPEPSELENGREMAGSPLGSHWGPEVR